MPQSRLQVRVWVTRWRFESSHPHRSHAQSASAIRDLGAGVAQPGDGTETWLDDACAAREPVS
jgi:hypothetical protein